MMLEDQSMTRQIVDLAVAAGRQMQNPQTGMIHHHYQTPQEVVAVTIPLVENFLFALALCRSRVAEQIQEAKQLIGHLLRFQVLDGTVFDGNFPVYLHEYPLCNERERGCALLPIFCRLLADYHAVLGSALVADLDRAAEKLLTHGFRTHAEKPLSTVAAVQLAAGALALGRRWGRDDMILEGKRIMNLSPSIAWGSPDALGHLVVALRLTDCAWDDLKRYLCATFHRTLYCYAGPVLEGFQSGDEPQVTLYDLLFATVTNVLPKRVKENCPLLLYGALVDEWGEMTIPDEADGELVLDGYRTAYRKTEAMAFSSVTGGAESKHSRWKGIDDLAVLWQGREAIHSIVAQCGGTLHVEEGRSAHQVVVMFDVAEGEEEVDFYLDKAQGCVILVEEVPANSFLPGEKLLLKSASMGITLDFAVEGDVAFRGHVMPGNRPAQLEIKGQKRFNAYDWKVFLRRLRGKGPCKVIATLTFHQVEW